MNERKNTQAHHKSNQFLFKEDKSSKDFIEAGRREKKMSEESEIDSICLSLYQKLT